MKKSNQRLNDEASRKRSTNRVIQAGITAAKKAGASEETIQALQSMLRKV